MYKVILFDLDGTLTESGEGITKSVQYALEKLGKPEDDLKKLEVFVGPPLLQQFMEYAGLDEETGIKAVEYYRERYSTVGIILEWKKCWIHCVKKDILLQSLPLSRSIL